MEDANIGSNEGAVLMGRRAPVERWGRNHSQWIDDSGAFRYHHLIDFSSSPC